MVDEIENKESDSDLEADFPSFLRSDNPENHEHDINHFLEDDKLSGDDSTANTQTFSGWNDGFEDAEKTENDADWDIDLGDINAPIDNLNLGDIDINQPVFDEASVSEAMEDVSENSAADEAVFNMADTMPEDSTMSEEDISAEMEDEDVISTQDAEKNIQFMNDEVTPPSSIESKVPNPEDYMSFDVPLEHLGQEDTSQPSTETQEIPESEFIAQNAPVHIHDMPRETFVEDSDQPYVEVLPGNQNMKPEEYMSYDLPDEAIGATAPQPSPTMKEPEAPTDNMVVSSSPNEQSAPITPMPDVSKVEQAEKETFQMFKWYSGHEDDKYYRISSEIPSGEFVGSAEQKSIYVDIGTSAYGWNVIFDNGISMNLSDVREFQLRNGQLPFAGGVITYGLTKLKFSQVDRIVVGSIPEYFHYGF